MDKRTTAQLAQLVGGQLIGDPNVLVGPDVVIDSREITQGALFVALPGEHVDGHSFVAQAAAAGAGAALVRQRLDVGLPLLLVEDALTGLGALAKSIVDQARSAKMRSVGITGSSGKTSTKDLLYQLFESVAPSVAPIGSFNNEIGVPITATKVDSQTCFLISEMGSRGIGHIRDLTQIIGVDTALVVNVGPAHLGEFGSIENVAQAKSELIEAAQDWAVLNADDPWVRQMTGQTQAKIATFAVRQKPDFGDLRIWATQLRPDSRQRFSFSINCEGQVTGAAQVNLQVTGEKQVDNACAAAAVAFAEGLSIDQVATVLSRATARSKWRMEISETPTGFLLINDAYNANPTSMKAALTTLGAMRKPSGRLIAVLGDMLELGETSAALHQNIGEYAAEVGVDVLIAVGQFRQEIAAGALSGEVQVRCIESPNEAVELVQNLATPQDVVLVKASRGLALENLVQALLATKD